MGTGRVLIACVAEDRPAFHRRVETLCCSLRALGGPIGGSDAVAIMLGSAEGAFVQRMRALDVEVCVVAQAGDARPAHANKLAMLELCRRRDFDVLLALDCDVALARDVTVQLHGEALTLTPADTDPLSDAQWRALFSRLSVGAGQRSLRATRTGAPMYSYFNSGVLAVPRELGTRLLAGWEQALEQLRRLCSADPRIVPPSRRFYADQLALAVAVRRGLPWVAASPELNFPTHLAPHEPTVRGLSPALLHYHDEADRHGFLYRPVCPLAHGAADEINRARATLCERPYGGLRPRPAPSAARVRVRSELGRAVASLRDACVR
jgi:hypothetical protein